jgi:biopolymer transport protein ExbB
MILGKSVWEVIHIGGIAMYLLICCSILSIGIFLERLYYYRKRSMAVRDSFMDQMKKILLHGRPEEAVNLCRGTDAPFADVASAALRYMQEQRQTIAEAMSRAIIMETRKLERHTSIVGTIGSTALYLGLFGTVLGVIRAFHDISITGGGGIPIVIGGVSEALVCTAAGLLVAIPAVIAYNWFVRRIDGFVADMEMCASEMVELLETRKR